MQFDRPAPGRSSKNANFADLKSLQIDARSPAVRQCSVGANYGRGNCREIARGTDIAAAPPLGPGLPDWESASRPRGRSAPYRAKPLWRQRPIREPLGEIIGRADFFSLVKHPADLGRAFTVQDGVQVRAQV